MSSDNRQNTIINYLKVQPSSHGQLDIELLAIPDKETVKSEISQDERKLIEQTFREQGTNLIPIIVRRIEPDKEEHEYEVVYGQKWCIIAEELGIERLWTWVFDLENDEVPLIQQKMAALAGSQPLLEPKKLEDNTNSVQLIDIMNRLQENHSYLINQLNKVQESYKNLNNRIEELEKSSHNNLQELNSKLNEILSKISSTTTTTNNNTSNSDILNAFNNWKIPDLKSKLQKLNINNMNQDKFERGIRSIENERKHNYFTSLSNLQQRVNGWGKATFQHIKENWNSTSQ